MKGTRKKQTATMGKRKRKIRKVKNGKREKGTNTKTDAEQKRERLLEGGDNGGEEVVAVVN